MFPRSGMGSWGKNLLNQHPSWNTNRLARPVWFQLAFLWWARWNLCSWWTSPSTGRSHTGCWAALCTQVQAQWHNLDLKSFGFSPKVPQRHLHMRQSVSLYHDHILSHDVPSWQQLPGSWAAQSTQNHTKLVAAWLLFQLEQVSTLLLKGLWNCGNACGTVVTVNVATHWNLLNTLNSSICSLTWEIEIMYSIVCRLYHERFNVELLYHCTIM